MGYNFRPFLQEIRKWRSLDWPVIRKVVCHKKWSIECFPRAIPEHIWGILGFPGFRKTGFFQVSGIAEFRVSGIAGFPGFWDSGILGFWDSGIAGFWDSGIPGFWDCRIWDSRIGGLPNPVCHMCVCVCHICVCVCHMSVYVCHMSVLSVTCVCMLPHVCVCVTCVSLCLYVVCLTYNHRFAKLCASQIIFGKIYPLEAAFPMVRLWCLRIIYLTSKLLRPSA